MAANILAFAEARAGELRKTALESVTAARSIADAAGGEVHAILFGAPGIASKAAALTAHGADLVLVVEHEGFERYNPEAATATLAAQLATGSYRLAIMGSSALGRDLAPRVAARAAVPLASDVIALQLHGDTLMVQHPVNTGKVVSTLAIEGSPVIVTVRPGTYALVETAGAGRVETLAPAGDPSGSRVRVTEMVIGNSAKLDLGEAPVIISGGRGLKAAANFALIEELADAFGNAAVGATRAVTDDGWRPHSDQIGQTGRWVSPDLYIAVGISGAIQHLAGMRTARTIVAINKDKDAPIFKIADYGVVGDALEIVPALTNAVREARKER